MSRMSVILTVVSTATLLAVIPLFFGERWDDWGYIQKVICLAILLGAWELLQFAACFDRWLAEKPQRVRRWMPTDRM